MSYLVLARKWRPRQFSDVVGQDHVLKALTNALDSERLHHAYLFSGTRGVGKTTIARIFAKALNCEEGISAEPCGKCSACREIDEGRFVDLIEVDAASKTKVDDTRELLDNVQFAPAGGRFKVYLIDEVHMLTKHSFNALLKTLEEPPPHVKFLLATTDPQKLLVTVLSRCLQFNLKRLTPQLIREHLAYLCGEEGIEVEAPALGMIARAADGSVRDALSLLDQAIAFCGGTITEALTSDMLGTVDRQHVLHLLERLAAGDAAGLMDLVATVDEQFPDYEQLLDELAGNLQKIAVLQAVGTNSGVDDVDHAPLLQLASQLSPESLQLYYQIAIVGRRDLKLAPDPRSGVEMTLLRMLAFEPASPAPGQVAPVVPAAATPNSAQSPDGAAPAVAQAKSPASPPAAVEPASPADASELDWAELVTRLDVKGAIKLLAVNCALIGREGDEMRLSLDKAAESYLTPARGKALEKALADHFGRKLKLSIIPGEPADETPIQAESRREDESLDAARERLESDPNVKSLIDVFGATLNSDSVRVVDKQ